MEDWECDDLEDDIFCFDGNQLISKHCSTNCLTTRGNTFGNELTPYHTLSTDLVKWMPATTKPASPLDSADFKPLCSCSSAAALLTAKTAENAGRQFFKCAHNRCKFFIWADHIGRIDSYCRFPTADDRSNDKT